MTPKKNISDFYRKESIKTKPIRERREKCAGSISFRVKVHDGIEDAQNARGSCVVCRMKTNYYCLNSKHYTCGPMKDGVFKWPDDEDNEDPTPIV